MDEWPQAGGFALVVDVPIQSFDSATDLLDDAQILAQHMVLGDLVELSGADPLQVHSCPRRLPRIVQAVA